VGKSYAARVEFISGTGKALFRRVEWAAKGDVALWSETVPADDAEAGGQVTNVFGHIAKPKAYYYQARVRVLNRIHGGKCWSSWSSWTSPVQPATLTPIGPPAPDGIVLSFDRVEGAKGRPWRAKLKWNTVPEWAAPDGDDVEVQSYQIRLRVYKADGSTLLNTRRGINIPHDPDETLHRHDFGNIRGRRHYSASVRTKAEGVWGAWSGWTSIASPGGAPAPPTNVQTSQPAPRKVEVTWDPPTDLTDVDRYKIEIHRIGGGAIVKTARVAEGTHEYVWEVPKAEAELDHSYRARVFSIEAPYSEAIDDDAPSEGDHDSEELSSYEESGVDQAVTEQWTADDLDLTGVSVPTSDGDPPASSPTPAVAGGPSFLNIAWPVVANADPVTYEVHVGLSAAFTPDSSTFAGEVSGTSMFVREQPDGEPLAYDTTYYVQIIAKDADGAASPGSEASGSLVPIDWPDISADAVRANHILAGSIDAEKLALVLLLASTIQTLPDDEDGTKYGVHIGTQGIEMFDSEGIQSVSIPTAGSPSFRGTIEALGLDVLGKMTLRGADNVIEQGATVTLRDKTANPAAAPTVSFFHESILTELDAEPLTDRRGLFYDSTNTSFWTAGYNDSEERWYIYEVDTDGSLIRSDQRNVATLNVYGTVRAGTKVYVLVDRTVAGTRQYYLQRHAESDLDYEDEENVTDLIGSQDRPGLTVVSGEPAVVSRANDASNDLVATPFNSSLVEGTTQVLATGTFPSGTKTFGAVLVNVGGTNYWHILVESGGTSKPVARVYVANASTDALVPSMYFFPQGYGLAHDGSNFLTGAGERFTIHSNFLVEEDVDKLFVRYAYEDASNFTTERSPLVTVFPPNREFVKVTVPEFPSGIDAAVVYAAKGTGSEPASLYEQVDSASRVVTLPETLVTSGATSPTSATLPSATPATFETEDGSALFAAYGFPRLRVQRQTPAQSISNTSETVIAWGSVGVDTESGWDDPNEAYDVPATGQYLVGIRCQWASNGSGRRRITLQRDTGSGFADTSVQDHQHVGGTVTHVSHCTDVVDLEAGDSLRVRVFQNSGGALDMDSANWFLVYLGPS
jgi:hypothetical protein